MNQEDIEFFLKWVEPYYMFLFNTRWCIQPDPKLTPRFVSLVKPALSEVNDVIIENMLSEKILGWRSRVVGCWFAGIKKREKYIDEISKSLGYNFRQMSTCFALVRFNNQKAIKYLANYLEQFIACERNLSDNHWNRAHWTWAIQALTYLDRPQGDYFYHKYYFAKNKLENNDLEVIYIKDKQLIFKRMESFCKLHFE